MKKIKNLTVKVEYTVTLGDVVVEDEVFEELKANELFEGSDSEENVMGLDWLENNIKEVDAYEYSFEVEDIVCP